MKTFRNMVNDGLDALLKASGLLLPSFGRKGLYGARTGNPKNEVSTPLGTAVIRVY
jgi:hypothetical protein